MMLDANQMPAESPESPAKWVSVREAAAALRVSEKTVRKRIAAGEIPARRVSQIRGGIAYLVALETETETEAKWNRSGSEKTPFQTQKALETETEREANRKRDGSETEVELLRESLESERKNSAFLRNVIEQLQRDGAETRAALREALKLAPKMLAAPESSMNGQSANFASESPQNGQKRQSEGNGQNGAQIALKRQETPVSLGDVADWLEKELS